jgi:CO dehydrogenase/acetyl-CoA synthase epsilon subunit
MIEVMKKMRKERTSHTKRKMTRKESSTRRIRKAKLTLLVIGSPTLSHHVSPPAMKATMKKRRSSHW